MRKGYVNGRFIYLPQTKEECDILNCVDCVLIMSGAWYCGDFLDEEEIKMEEKEENTREWEKEEGEENTENVKVFFSIEFECGTWRVQINRVEVTDECSEMIRVMGATEVIDISEDCSGMYSDLESLGSEDIAVFESYGGAQDYINRIKSAVSSDVKDIKDDFYLFEKTEKKRLGNYFFEV